MKKINLIFLSLILISCGSTKLPSDFVGTYYNKENGSEIIIIENIEGDFIEKTPSYTLKGKFTLEDLSNEAKETFIKITGFEVKEGNPPDGIHTIGLMDYDNCTSSFKLNDNKRHIINLTCPTYGGLNQIYIKF